MINSINFPLDEESINAAGGLETIKKKLLDIGLDGVEGIWSGADVPDYFPSSLLTGYHLTFFLDWLDFYHGLYDKVYERFQNDENIILAFGGLTPDDMIKTYKDDVSRAQKLNASYMVFHVSDITFEECYTYRWIHTDEDVIDASIEILNTVLKDVEPTFDLLVENQWWPGFRFTDPVMTERLLSGIDYPRKGIMLDTGHLMNTNLNLKNQADGIAYILKMLELHGSLSEYVEGLHFHQSVSGAYTKAHTGYIPDDYPPDYLGRFNHSYGHILHIDRHMPWTNTDCVKILERVKPLYLTHEMSGGGKTSLFGKAKRQMNTIKRGFKKLESSHV